MRASAAIANDPDVVIVGSQSILGTFENADARLLVSMEADVFPRSKPELSDLIDGSIGEGSPFHETYGYYAQGVGPETAVVAAGWEARLVAIRNENTLGATGWCLEANDLLLSKYVAGREKDAVFTKVAADCGYGEAALLLRRVEQLQISEALKQLVRGRIRADYRRG